MIKPSLADWVFEDWSQITGSQRALPKGNLRQHPCQLRIRFLNPFNISLPCRYPGNIWCTYDGEIHSCPKYPFPLLGGFARSKPVPACKWKSVSQTSMHWAPFSYRPHSLTELISFSAFLLLSHILHHLSSEKQAQPMADRQYSKVVSLTDQGQSAWVWILAPPCNKARHSTCQNLYNGEC